MLKMGAQCDAHMLQQRVKVASLLHWLPAYVMLLDLLWVMLWMLAFTVDWNKGVDPS